MRRIQRLREFFRVDPVTWRGAATALGCIGWLIAVSALLQLAIAHFAWQRALGVAAGLAIATLAAILALGLVYLLRRGPYRFWWGALLTTAMLAITAGIVISPQGFAALLAAVVISACLLGGGIAKLRSHGFAWPRVASAAIGGLATAALTLALLLPGWGELPNRDWQPQHADAMALPDPGASGPWQVRTLTYGSGADRHRPEFAADADLRSDGVDGSHLIDGWSGASGWLRTQYWGFDATQLPRQGRVWFPDGDGPFPLLLMVHGNHDMEDFSDPGYAYLGELLASRGIIAVSVDENFLNSSYADLVGGFTGGLSKENDARAWLLLEHLRLWRQWNFDPQNRFYRKVDLDRVALLGHSRGGEAVAIAAQFNRLPFYPDDARVTFDYGFGLRGVMAIAPSDAQYEPRNRPTRFNDVSYLVIQGSNDGDVQSYMGAAQYSRVGFHTCSDCFKAGVYLIGANHGQFNTRWGRNDLDAVWGRMLNLTPIMDAQAQRRVAKALFGAFAEVVLNDRTEYRPFLENPARGLAWLGSDVEFVNQYAAANETAIANFEEDADLTTGSLPGVKITAVDLARWHEAEVPLKLNDLDSAVALIAWNRTDDNVVPELHFNFDVAPAPVDAVSFSLAMSDSSPLDDEAAWTAPESVDFHVEATDRAGHRAAVALSTLQPLHAPIAVTTRKLALLDAVDPSEPVFQRYTIPLDRFDGVDPTQLTSLRLRFDVTGAGAMYLDDVATAPQTSD